jgi:hypothetical protein
MNAKLRAMRQHRKSERRTPVTLTTATVTLS